MKQTITIELDRGQSRVIYKGKETSVKTAWLRKMSINDLSQSLIDNTL